MIVARLEGGMGNQMFQLSMAYACAREHNTNIGLNIDSFRNDAMRQYSLGLWVGVNSPIVPVVEPVVQEEGLPYNPETISRITDNCTLKGYWQSEKYFKNLRSDLAGVFTPRFPLTYRGKENLKKICAAGHNSIFLTIRRSDYTTSDFHGVLPIDYYNKAMTIIAAKINDPEIFVFSDEPEWCEQNIRFPYKTHVCGNYDRTTNTHLGREDEELWLMRHCKHAIMANSSYSWWGAWLGADVAGGTIVAPERWFQNANENPRDICPSRWIKI